MATNTLLHLHLPYLSLTRLLKVLEIESNLKGFFLCKELHNKKSCTFENIRKENFFLDTFV